MIHVICPNCRAKLQAKDRLVGQTRHCPRCNARVLLVPAAETTVRGETTPPPQAQAATEELPLSRFEGPRRLDRSHHYLICDNTKLIAAWENNGQGWRVKTDYGFASALRNPEKLPSQGDFKLVELRMGPAGGDFRLRGIRVYQLARRWALTSLERGDDLICKSITGPGFLIRAQKDAIRRQLQDRYMRTVWGDATEVLDYLANGDYHSPGAGQ